MARNTVALDQVVGDFMLIQEGDDYTTHSSEMVVRNIALRGIREMGFDVSKKIRSLKLTINKDNNTVELPDDFVDLTKVGIVGADGKVYVFPSNKHINYSQTYANSAGTAVNTAVDAADSDSDGVFNRIDAKGATGGGGDSLSETFDSYIFSNFVQGSTNGRLYGLGGGGSLGAYRLNLDQNRLEIEAGSGYSEVVIEYVADEARSANPDIHVYIEEALRSYMYYKLIERKSTVPMAEKSRARAEYYNERRKANSRMSNFTKQEALHVISKNFRQSPKV
tara:strand:- start:5952 stop:6788 length:837 start_codon:yes stop_codon:yes gene_type:complete